MAENKKSFVLYADLIHTVKKMPPDLAGRLFVHILEYVNDLNPETDELLLQISFEPIKQQLKRDLKDWEEECSRRSEIGRLGGIKSAESRALRKNQPNSTEVNLTQPKLTEVNQGQPNQADNVTDTVNDTVKEKRGRRVFTKPELAQLDEYFKQIGFTQEPGIAQKFIDYYESKGWLVGKSPMKDWKAACRTWHTSWKEKHPAAKPVIATELILQPRSNFNNDWEFIRYKIEMKVPITDVEQAHYERFKPSITPKHTLS